MNAMPDSFVVNSCQYTPVYLIQDPGASQIQSYFLTQSNVEEPKPVSDNLKAFYESSGNLEALASSIPKPRILKKQENGAIGNNLKLASFLQPKNDSLKQQYLMNSIVVKPNVTLINSNGITSSVTYTTGNNTRLNIDSKIVKLKDVALKTRYNRIERVPQPKNNKPKDNIVTAVIPVTVPVTTATVQVPINVPTVPATVLAAAPTLPTKNTSVQLLKLGETYHSLNELSEEQVTMVTQALKIFNQPEKVAPEPSYDPVTNTKFIYKVLSPRDLTVVGKNKVPRHKLKEAARLENMITKELRKEFIRESVKKANSREAYKEDQSENAEQKFLIKCLKQQKIISEVKAEKLKAELRKENMLKAEAKRELLIAEAKKIKARAEAKKEEMKKELSMKKAAEEKFMNLQKQILDEQEAESKTKVTRSGRKVKLPKPVLPEKSPHKPKKKTTIISCFQCAVEFNSLYRLQKHYESHPTHIPSKIHSNLFHCLLAIVLSGAEADRSNIFLQQLQQLVVKLRSLMPCFLKDSEKAQDCTVSEDVAGILGLFPGKYALDISALDCVKNTEGYCRHNPPPPPPKIEPDTAANQSWATIKEEIQTVTKNPTSELEIDDCARINSVEKWPTVNKRVWKQKQQKSVQENAKRMRLTSENNDTFIELGLDDFVDLPHSSCSENSAIINPQGAEHKADSHLVNEECNFEQNPMKVDESKSLSLPQDTEPNVYLTDPTNLLPDTANLEQIATTIANLEEQNKKNNHLQFHSAHFDIRSSPIKPTSTVFRKFQINPELLAKYENQVIRSIETVDKVHETSLENNENMTEHFNDVQTVQTNHNLEDKRENSEDTTDHLVGDDTLGEIFRDEDLSAVKESFILDRELKDWILNRSNDEKSEDGFGKPNTVIEPSLMHVKDNETINAETLNIEPKAVLEPSDNHDESSVLNFLDTFGNDSLSFPGSEIRTNGDFQLDLFSFHSS